MDNMGLEMFKMWKSSWESYVKNLQMMQDQGDNEKAYFKAVEENFKHFEELFEK